VSGIRPNKEQFIELMNAPDEGPVVMLNLLKFKSGGGSKEYGKYGRSAVDMVEARGGKVLWMGRVDQTLIGDVDEQDWDAIALVQYPSRKAFVEMTSTKEYEAAHEHRESGLERTVLLACTQRGGAL
jgi:uncharacterized protein (DUF1330 family)